LPLEEISISSGTKILSEDGLLLSDYDVKAESTVNVDLLLLGGAKKKKKKVFTKPKKKKHAHKKRKLAILNYYRIDKDGKINRIKLECEKCGASTFMADHKDRHTCGKCGNMFYKVKKEEVKAEGKKGGEGKKGKKQ